MKITDMDKLYCACCGSDRVEARMWVNPNTNEIGNFCEDFSGNEDNWCLDCTDYAELLTIQELWERFSNVPIDNEDKIKEGFLLFQVGTPKLDVLYWFYERGIERCEEQ